MELLVLDTNFQAIDVVDTFKSLIWTDRYNGDGDFEIYLPIDTKSVKNLRSDYYLWNSESEHLMVIEQIVINSDIEEGNHLIVSGRSIEMILSRRIVWEQTILNGNLQEVIKQLLNDNIINPSLSSRRIDNFIFVESTDPIITSINIETQYHGENLYDVIYNLCIEHSIGFKITLNELNQFVFSLYVGVDRSYDQTDNPYVIFSPDFDNIINSSYLESKVDSKNVALVAGEGEGSDRKTSVVGDVSGIDRREIFVDASNISTNIGDGNTLTDEQYTEQLNQKGAETIAENSNVVSFDGEVEGTRMFKYGEDFFIGDIVQVANEYGHEGVAIITEIIMSQNQEGISMYPTFVMI